MRAPEAPIGWPKATAPPLTLVFAGSSPSSWITARACTAKASFSSKRSTSWSFQPTFLSSACTALTGAIITHLGSTPLTAWPTTRAMGSVFNSLALSAEVTISAAAPSLVPGALPAVTVPPGLKAGLSLAKASRVVSARGDSSAWNNLLAKAAALDGVHCPAMTLAGVCVLALARDAVLLGYQFARHAHVEVFIGIPQPILDHGVQSLGVAEAIALAELREKVRGIAHGLHAAGHHGFHVARPDALCGERHSLQPGAAHLVDRHGRHARVEPALQPCLACRVLPQPRLDHVAHDDFVHLGRLDACPLNGFSDDDGAQIDGRKRR